MGLRKVPLHLCSEKETNTFFYKLADTYNQYYYWMNQLDSIVNEDSTHLPVL